ncbi:MAG: hypothetical protein HY938_07640 [Nitrosomonadales bacterium]|nr:hypothetical protein [Nitrosomonadales bacterium]
MKNSIDAHIEFSFKGETHSLTSTLDLDQLFEYRDSLPAIHALLAREHGIDTYSYLYEVMQAEEIEFRNAQGIAADFMADGVFNHEAFAAGWQDRKILTLLQPIASRELDIADLEQNQALKNALIQAYNLGRETPPS